MAATKRKRNLSATPKAGSRGYDVVIGPRRKHFESHAAARSHGLDQQNKGVHAEFVIVDSATGKRERFKRSGAKNPQYHAAYEKAKRADDAFQAALEKQYGTRAGDMRYQTSKLPPRIKALAMKYQKAAEAMRKANPEAAAVEMYEKFHGKPSKRIDTVTDEVHVHEHLAALGDLIEMKVKTIKGETFTIEFDREDNPHRGHSVVKRTKGWIDRRFKALSGIGKRMAETWINPRSTNPRRAVVLASSEDGRNLFCVGGQQTLSLSKLGLGELSEKESVVIGPIMTVTYFTTKDFGDGPESFDYEHKFSEESNGPRPMLRYSTIDKKCHIDGGVFTIPKPLIGTSGGITD